MSNPIIPPLPEASKHIEQLLDSANSASQTVAALHIAFLAFLAYVGVIVWGTTHEDLLLISPVKLPILDVELPLTAFYNFVPWMVVLLHFNLLMQLELLSCKLWKLDQELPDSLVGQQVRNRLFIFPFTHLLAARSPAVLIRWLLSLIVGITVIALPLFMLLAAQIRFLPFHDETITGSQRLAVWVDAVMLLTLWPLIASPQDRAMEWWQNAVYRLLGYWPASIRYFVTICRNGLVRLVRRFRPTDSWHEIVPQAVFPEGSDPKGMIVLLISVPLVILLSFFAVVPGSMTLQAYEQQERAEHRSTPRTESSRYFEDWLIRKVPESWLSVAAYRYDTVTCTSLPMADKSEASIQQVMLGPCLWFDWGLFPRNLDLREARLVPKGVSLSLLTRATDRNKTVRDNAFKEFDGLNLQKRDLRFANLFGAVLPKADLRHVQLQGAVLLKAKLQGVVGWDKTQLQGAILGGTQLQGAGLIEADLRNADLRGADLQGADLSWANLQGADLRGADMQAVNAHGTKMQGADLRGAKLQGANLREANMQGASLDYARLQGADMAGAMVQAAMLHNTELGGIDWTEALLDAAFLTDDAGSVWNEQNQRQLLFSLKPLLDAEKFAVLQDRLKDADRAGKQKPQVSHRDCYSSNERWLACPFNNPLKLDAYRQSVLFPRLVELACSDTAIGAGLARRADGQAGPVDPVFGLAAALVNAMDQPTPCDGLASLSDQAQDKLKKAAEQEARHYEK